MDMDQQMEEYPGENYDQQYIPMACCAGEQVDENQLDKLGVNPKEFDHLPSCFTQHIKPAGRTTFRSESVFNVLRYE